MKTPKLLSLAALLALVAAPVHAQDQTPPATSKIEVREITLEICPAPVREAVNRALKNGKPDDIHQITREGNTFYTAEIDMPDGRDVKLWLRPDGAVTKTETEVRLKDAPAPVREALEKLAVNGAEIDDLKQCAEGDTTTWSAEIDRKNAPDLKVKVAPDGTVLKQREERED